ncbi:MAG: signal recognition particle-docking protein FtsY [Caldisericaceae bacterium]
MNILERLKNLISKKSVNLDEVEEFLLSKNFGVRFTEEFISKFKKESIDYIELFKKTVKEAFVGLDTTVNLSKEPPTVFIFVGSNGSGKTTSIAKVANFYKQKGFKNILLIAGDTFRAGAIDQLSIWAERLGVDIMKGKPKADPASVIFDGLSKSNNYDLILIDTSGRVETNENLLKELTKIEKVVLSKTNRINEVFLVMDSLTGLNLMEQVDTFTKAIKVTGIILTKFDTSSYPGVVIPITEKYKIPIKFIGTGEDINDLEEFSSDFYINKLIGGVQ